MYTLRCVAPDGDFVTEGRFDTIDEAWERADDMGSRWIFYPFYVVTGATPCYNRARVVSLPDGLPAGLKGKSFKTFRDFIADNSEFLLETL